MPAFNVACFIVGIILIPIGGSLDTIGISLTVGALFAFGAFAAQFWTVLAQSEQTYLSRIYESDIEVKEMMKRWFELSRKLETLQKENPASKEGG